MARIEILKKNIFHNLDRICERVKKEKVSVVLKDNAYGHGLLEVAALCCEYGMRHAVVRNYREAACIAKFFDSVLVLADMPGIESPKNAEYVVNSLAQLKSLDTKTKLHLKIDTGMHRNGIARQELHAALETIKSRNLRLCGVMSHLRSADELSAEFFWQSKNFLSIRDEVIAWSSTNGIDRPIFHLHNSAGVFRCADFSSFDRVRVGIAMYGYMQMPAAFDKIELKPAMRLVAQKIASRALGKGARIGYGGGYELEAPAVVSTYDIGYADGFFRLNERDEYTLSSGERLLGRVSMDNFSALGDSKEVCLFDDASALASVNDTIVYDVLAKLSSEIPRVVV